MSKKITGDNFETQVLSSDKPILVDFYSTTCGPCMMLAPILEELAETETDYYIGKVNVEEDMALTTKYSVRVVPTLLIFKDGECVKRFEGLHSKEQLTDIMKGVVG
ncbi:MAG: thioredoxin [Lachnospiraceae bacterium]|nr:thioredoxin [Lachnospiraceae bacterium]